MKWSIFQLASISLRNLDTEKLYYDPCWNYLKGFNRWTFHTLLYIDSFLVLAFGLVKGSEVSENLAWHWFKIKTFPHIVNIRYFLVLAFVFLLPSVSFAEETIAATQVDLKHHFVGYLAVALTVLAYAIAMTEDMHQLSKAKPMVLGRH